MVTIGFVTSPTDSILRCDGVVHTDDDPVGTSAARRPTDDRDRARALAHHTPRRAAEHDRRHSVVASSADDEQIVGAETTQQHPGGRVGG